MRFLLDTQLLLWLLASPNRVPLPARRMLLDAWPNVHFSVASVWEIAIKRSLGRLDFDAAPVADHAERDGFVRLPIAVAHVCEVERLPWHHRDPFDRLLVAQSIVEPLTLLTADAALARYGPTVRVV